jgi:hypothetical protein
MSRPRFLIASFVVVLLLGPATCVAADEPRTDSRAGGEAAVVRALAEKTSLDVTETPLSVVLERLGKRHSIPIVIDDGVRRTLAKANISLDAPVTVQLSGVSLKAAIGFLLRNIRYVRCTWAVCDGALLITTEEEAKKILTTKAYPVEDLVAGHDRTGKVTDGSKELCTLVSDLLSLDEYNRTERIAGTAVRIVPLKEGRGLSVTHNRWAHEKVADLLEEMRSAIRRGQTPAQRSAAEKKITAALNEPTAIEFIETPLKDVIDYLKDKHKIEIQIDKTMGDYGGIEANTPVSINVKGVSLGSALRLMLRRLGLTYIVQSEVLLITMPEQMEVPTLIQAYDIADLVTSHDRAKQAGHPERALEEAVFAHTDRLIYWTDATPGWSRRFSNGRVQLLAARIRQNEDSEIEWLLAEIRKIGRRRSADSERPAVAAESGSTPPRRLATVLPGEEAIQKALARKSTFHFWRTPLTDVIDYFKDLFKIEIQFDRRALSDQGTSADSPVTIKASDITLRVALKRILRPHGLCWTIQDETLLITITDEADSHLVTKVYAVDDLPDRDLPTKTDPMKDISSRTVISSDAVRALVVTAPYADQEAIAAKLAAAREKAGRRTKTEGR